MSVDPRTQSLFAAIAAVDYSQVKHLIESGVPVNSVDDRGKTPLAIACIQGDLQIVDLLMESGARMYVESDVTPIQPNNRSQIGSIPGDWDPTSIESEVTESPIGNREITYKELMNPIDRLTEIDRPSHLNWGLTASVSPTAGQNLSKMAQGWREIESDAEATCTFDLDEAFATNDKPNMFVDSEQTMTSLNSSVNPIEWEANETYAFDLSKDLLPRSFSKPEEADDRLLSNIGEWEEGETYAIDLSNLDGDGGETYAIDLDCLLDSDSPAKPLQMDEFSLDEPIDLSNLDGDEGETYAIDLDCLLDSDSPAKPLQMDEFSLDEPIDLSNLDGDEGETYAIDLDCLLDSDSPAKLLQMDEFSLDDDFLDDDDCYDDSNYDPGETYAIDLDDLDPYELMDKESGSKHLERKLLSEIAEKPSPILPERGYANDELAFSIEAEDRTPKFGGNDLNKSLIAAITTGDLDLTKQMVAAGADLVGYDWDLGYCPLGMAIERGHLKIVQFLLGVGANPHGGSTSTTALGLATEQGETEMMNLLLSSIVDVNAPVAADGWTALLTAIKKGHHSIVQLLVTAGANVNVWSRGETPILLAAKCDERDIYQYLYPLVNTAIRLCADRDGEQLLSSTRKRRIREQNRLVEKFISMATAGNLDEVRLSLEAGVEIDEFCATGHNALMAAAYYGHQPVVRVLLEAGANPNLLSDGDDGLGYGMSALMFVASSFFASNRDIIAKMLIAGGADVDLQSEKGKTAIMFAATSGSGYRACVEILVAAGANLNLRDDRGHTVLTLVAAAENYPMFNLLLQAGASTDGLESIQLIQAARTGDVDRVKSLLSAQVDLNLDRGDAIGSAAAAGHTEIVRILIQAGANVNLSDRSGFTPLASAAYAGYGEIVRLLIDAGADIQASAGGSHSYSALKYAQMGLRQFGGGDRQHTQIIRQLSR
jgi:ankyrin repeat protein